MLLNLAQLFATLTGLLKSQLLTLLIKTFERRVIDTNEFIFIIDTGHIRYFVACYKRHIESCVTIINGVYYCCKLFVSLLLSIIVLRSDPMIVAVLDKNAINMAFFNYCSWKIDKYRFYYLCFNILKQKKVLKFSFVNKINIVMFKITYLFWKHLL